jgi:hypothetical protein
MIFPRMNQIALVIMEEEVQVKYLVSSEKLVLLSRIC